MGTSTTELCPAGFRPDSICYVYTTMDLECAHDSIAALTLRTAELRGESAHRSFFSLQPCPRSRTAGERPHLDEFRDSVSNACGDIDSDPL